MSSKETAWSEAMVTSSMKTEALYGLVAQRAAVRGELEGVDDLVAEMGGLEGVGVAVFLAGGIGGEGPGEEAVFGGV